MAAQGLLNRDGVCPTCGSGKVEVVGPPGKVIDASGAEMQVAVSYSKVIMCTNCRQVRGR